MQISLEDLKKIYNGKTFLATRGVDENIFYQTRVFSEKPQEKFTVAFCGKDGSPEKGLKEFIEPACKKAGVRLIANTRNFTDALTPNQMREFYNKADAYIVASVMDGTPNPALEAGACGIPIVSNRIGNMPELIRNHKNGWLVERDIEAYARRLIWMKENQKATFDIGQRLKKNILDEWTWDKVLNKNERNIFREVLK